MTGVIVKDTGLREGSSKERLSLVEKAFNNGEVYHLEELTTEDIKGKTPKDILITILIENLTKDTLDSEDNLQCVANRKRSQEDLYKIMKYYYPEITLVQLRNLLIELLTKDPIIASFFCPWILKRVYFLNGQQYNWYPGTMHEPTEKDEFGLRYTF